MDHSRLETIGERFLRMIQECLEAQDLKVNVQKTKCQLASENLQ